MIHLKSRDEIELLFEAGQIVARAHEAIERILEPGVSTKELDAAAEKVIRSHKAKPAFLGYHGYPATLCASINEEVVHGIPSSKRILEEDDLVGCDLGAELNGWIGDAARTHIVGKGSKVAEKLNRVTRECLYKALDVMVPGNRLGDIGHAVQTHAEKNGFSVVRDFVGHAVGRQLHEEPQVPNYGQKNKGIRLQEGMVLAIEPMINEGVFEVIMLDDGWTVITADNKLSAHWEHTIAITSEGPRILTGSES